MSLGRRVAVFSIALAAFAAESASAFAADWWVACTAERTRFCANVQAGGGRVSGCLDEHKDELSAACREARPAGSTGAGKTAPSVAERPEAWPSRPSHGRFISVDHTNYDDIVRAPIQLAERAGETSVFFAHASVGANIVSGLSALRSEDPSRYRIRVVNTGGVPPATTEKGVMYHFARGNPGWSAKVRGFEGSVRGGWSAPKVPVVMNKFCFIDQDADLDEYTRSMSAMETSYPNTVFVYATMPIMRNDGQARAEKRRAFNDGLRRWAAANGRVLFDIADIEAWSASGSPCGGLCAEYTSDGGHLGPEGQVRAARGFYSLLLRLNSR